MYAMMSFLNFFGFVAVLARKKGESWIELLGFHSILAQFCTIKYPLE